MKQYSTQGKAPLSEQELDSLNAWSLPDVQVTDEQELAKTNAMGKERNWRYEPPEEVIEEEPAPLTAEDIEAIRQAAYEEGFNQGKEEGFAAGFEEGKVAGHEQGVVSGHEEGLAQGLAEGQEEIVQRTSALEHLITQMHQPLANIDHNVEAQLLQLVLQLTQAVTLHEAKTNPDILISAITTGLKALPAQEAQTQILLNPSDIELVEHEFGADHIQQQGWRLLPAPQLTPGSCQIENSTSNIDLSLKAKLDEVLESFLQEALHQ